MNAVVKLVRTELRLLVREPLVLTFVFAFPVITVLVIAGAIGTHPSSAFAGAKPSQWYGSSYLAVVIATIGLVGYCLFNQAQVEHRLGEPSAAGRHRARAQAIFDATSPHDHPEAVACRHADFTHTLLRLQPCRLDSPQAEPVLKGLAKEYERRYQGSDEMTRATVDQFDPPDGLFIVLTDNDTPIAGGGYRHLEPGVCEVKRMWTHPDHRRHGHATAVLDALENAARQAGYTKLRLETGPKQDEAIALYQGRYRPINTFGDYDEDKAFEGDLPVSPKTNNSQ